MTKWLWICSLSICVATITPYASLYDDKKDKYIKSVQERFGDSERFKKLLLSETQMDENCGFIILVSRLNDLLVRAENGLFNEYYIINENYAQTIADTRHYYTHYGKSKEKKALKGSDLLEAIYILRVLLEYHICFALGINRVNAISQELRNHYAWIELSKNQNAKKQKRIDSATTTQTENQEK